MSYIQNNLAPNEKVLLSARVHPIMFLPAVLLFLLTIVMVIYSLSMAVQVSEPGAPAPIPTPEAFLGGFMLCISGGIFLGSIIVGIQALIMVTTTEFAVTNKRVLAKTGWLRRQTLELLLSKVESISVDQGILGRLLNFGVVTVTGTGGTKESFRAIIDPLAFRKKINQIIEHYAQNSVQK